MEETKKKKTQELSFSAKRDSISIYLCISGLLLLALLAVFWDNDNWWLMATGKYILNHGIPTINPFAAAEDLGIIVQQWLVCVINYITYHNLGNIGLYLLTVLYTGGLFFVLWKYLTNREVHGHNAALFSFLILFCMFSYCSLRPSIISYILLFLQFIICEQTKTKPGLKWIIPVLVLIEANVHTSFIIFHFVYLLPYIVPTDFFKKICKNEDIPIVDKNQFKNLIIIVPLMIGACFINPYGLDGILYLFRSYGTNLNKFNISELSAIELSSVQFWIVFAWAIFMSVYVIKRLKQQKPINSSDFYIAIGTIALIVFMPHYRNYGLIMLGAVPILGAYLKGKSPFTDFLSKTKPMTIYFLWFMAFCIIIFSGSKIYESFTSDKYPPTSDLPTEAVEYLNENGENDPEYSTKILTNFNNGGYFEYEGYKVFFDARPELYFKSINGKEDVSNDYFTFYYTGTIEQIEALLDKYNFDYCYVENSSRLSLYFDSDTSGEWEPVVETSSYKLYKHITIEQVELVTFSEE